MELTGQLHATVALSSVKETRYPLDRKQSGSQSRSGRAGEEKNVSKLIISAPRCTRYCECETLATTLHGVSKLSSRKL
jgi:hypothetical protein